MEYASSFKKLIEELKKLPGIGPKSAQRMAFYFLEAPKSQTDLLAEVINQAKDSLKNCSNCFNMADNDPCEICSDQSRDKSLFCVVEEPKDLMAIERTKGFFGLYHVLGGAISPIDGLGPSDLKIKELLKRIDAGVKEVVLAMNPTAQGEATVLYLTKLLTKYDNLKITRIAYGLPIGSDLDYADEATLVKSFEGRREVNV
ncbi:MAG: recombination protein RecR [Candidatus Saganbacteria bacterium]|uniref:Recombination protein RecR n=1 Tax=Candidatus Saganbacteria bacterium TaxID=2575572 RepID=A0A833L4D8_UNCSA|nr:MAG: recombination protein RecR [Candidatus Saganbacteria bacterium]